MHDDYTTDTDDLAPARGIVGWAVGMLGFLLTSGLIFFLQPD